MSRYVEFTDLSNYPESGELTPWDCRELENVGFFHLLDINLSA